MKVMIEPHEYVFYCPKCKSKHFHGLENVVEPNVRFEMCRKCHTEFELVEYKGEKHGK